jgi:hypothetical protein
MLREFDSVQTDQHHADMRGVKAKDLLSAQRQSDLECPNCDCCYEGNGPKPEQDGRIYPLLGSGRFDFSLLRRLGHESPDHGGGQKRESCGSEEGRRKCACERFGEERPAARTATPPSSGPTKKPTVAAILIKAKRWARHSFEGA